MIKELDEIIKAGFNFVGFFKFDFRIAEITVSNMRFSEWSKDDLFVKKSKHQGLYCGLKITTPNEKGLTIMPFKEDLDGK